MEVTVVKWYQPGDEEVDGWEFQYSINGIDWIYYEDTLSPVPCEICWQTSIELPDDAYLFRARSFREDIPSDWSDIMTLTEPDPVSVIAFAILLLAIMPKSFYLKLRNKRK